ncbi:MAG TPA: hypothetical protein VFA70_14330 [Dehalococcoidia bacterium]|nr:hypothetical protein [Dehalococcoidia bacterium]
MDLAPADDAAVAQVSPVEVSSTAEIKPPTTDLEVMRHPFQPSIHDRGATRKYDTAS